MHLNRNTNTCTTSFCVCAHLWLLKISTFVNVFWLKEHYQTCLISFNLNVDMFAVTNFFALNLFADVLIHWLSQQEYLQECCHYGRLKRLQCALTNSALLGNSNLLHRLGGAFFRLCFLFDLDARFAAADINSSVYAINKRQYRSKCQALSFLPNIINV